MEKFRGRVVDARILDGNQYEVVIVRSEAVETLILLASSIADAISLGFLEWDLVGVLKAWEVVEGEICKICMEGRVPIHVKWTCFEAAVCCGVLVEAAA